MEYIVDSLSFDNFSFEHSVPPVNMHAVHMKHVTPSLPLLQQAERRQPYHDLSEHCGRFTQNRHSGTSKAGLHGRDDELLRVSCLCSAQVNHM